MHWDYGIQNLKGTQNNEQGASSVEALRAHKTSHIIPALGQGSGSSGERWGLKSKREGVWGMGNGCADTQCNDSTQTQSTLPHSHCTQFIQTQCHQLRSHSVEKIEFNRKFQLLRWCTVRKHQIVEEIQKSHPILKEATNSSNGKMYTWGQRISIALRRGLFKKDN